jgi:hypothetical protein
MRLIIAIPALAAISLWTLGTSIRAFRQLAVRCIQNVYTNPYTLANVPSIPVSKADHIPSYIALCQVGLFHSLLHL